MSDKKKRTTGPVAAIPQEVFEREEATKPIELIERSSDRYQSDLAYRDEMNAIRDKYERDLAFRGLYNMFRRQRHESNSTLKGVADTALEAHQLAKQADVTALYNWKHEMDTIMRLAKWILGLVLAAALASVVVVATKIYSWGQSNGELEIRIQTLEKQLQQAQQAKLKPFQDMIREMAPQSIQTPSKEMKP